MILVHIHEHSEPGENMCISQSGFHPDLLILYQELGVIDLDDDNISLTELHRLLRIMRLRQNCGVNMAGAAIIVELLDRIEDLKEELRQVHRTRD